MIHEKLVKAGKALLEPKISWHTSWMKYHDNRINKLQNTAKLEMSSENLITNENIRSHWEKKAKHEEKLKPLLDKKRAAETARSNLREEGRLTLKEKRIINAQHERMQTYNLIIPVRTWDYIAEYKLVSAAFSVILIVVVYAGVTFAASFVENARARHPKNTKTIITYPDQTKHR